MRVPKYIKDLCVKLDREINLAQTTRQKIVKWMDSNGINTCSDDMYENYIWDDLQSVSAVSYDALVDYLNNKSTTKSN